MRYCNQYPNGMELVMDDWTKERDAFLEKIGQAPEAKATPKQTIKKEEE